MKLKKLLKDLPSAQVKGSKDLEITGVCANSKLVAPGNLFVAKKGRTDDGHRYIPDAVAAGAVAVLTDIYDPSLKNIVQVIHPDVHGIEGMIAAQYYQNPSDELFMVGVTGTNGKTTTSFLVKHLLDKLGFSCGLMGTIECIIGDHHYRASRLTTSDVETNHKLLREMRLHGCDSAVMEVTSHALDQSRVAFIDYDVAIFTNLSIDHLDYHQTMDKYYEAKNKLFRNLGTMTLSKKSPKYAVVNADSLWSKKMLEGCNTLVMTYGIENAADLRATDLELNAEGTKFKLSFKGETLTCSWPLVGRYNVYNSLAATAVGLIKGLSLGKIVETLATFPPVPGRLEPVKNSLGLKIYVDFAHTEDALVNVLECLKEFKKGKIITIFGCGGDRDRGKRPKMAQAAEENSDHCIVTSDNPRNEDPAVICSEVVTGFKDSKSFEVILDRRSAIEKAISMATKDDIILVAGKGHEKFQIFAYKTIEFDDCKVIQEICREKVKPKASKMEPQLISG